MILSHFLPKNLLNIIDTSLFNLKTEKYFKICLTRIIYKIYESYKSRIKNKERNCGTFGIKIESLPHKFSVKFVSLLTKNLITLMSEINFGNVNF